MAILGWLGGAPATSQVSSATYATYDATSTLKVTMNSVSSKTVSVLGSGGNITAAVAALVVALNASVIPEFAEVTWSSSSGTLIGTAKTAGKPITFTVSISGGTTTVGSITTVAGQGPYDANVAANYSGNALPTTGDTLIVQNGSNPILYNLDQLSGVTLAVFDLWMSFQTGNNSSIQAAIGLPQINIDNPNAPYPEYRPRYFQIGMTAASLGLGTGNGIGRCQIDNGSVQTALSIFNSGQPLDPNVRPILWKGTHASNVVNISKGALGVAMLAGEVATIATLTESYTTNKPNDAQVDLGPVVILGTVLKYGGKLNSYCAATTLTNNDGQLYLWSGAVTTVNAVGGTVYQNGNGTLGTVVIGQTGTFDATQGDGAFTATNASAVKGAMIKDSNARGAWTNGVMLSGGARFKDVNFDFGPNRTVKVS